MMSGEEVENGGNVENRRAHALLIIYFPQNSVSLHAHVRRGQPHFVPWCCGRRGFQPSSPRSSFPPPLPPSHPTLPTASYTPVLPPIFSLANATPPPAHQASLPPSSPPSHSYTPVLPPIFSQLAQCRPSLLPSESPGRLASAVAMPSSPLGSKRNTDNPPPFSSWSFSTKRPRRRWMRITWMILRARTTCAGAGDGWGRGRWEANLL